MKLTYLLYRLASVILMLISMAGCALQPTPAPDDTPSTLPPAPQLPLHPRLRIQNAGVIDIQGLVVLFPDSRIVFGDIPSGATTDYQNAPQGVYNYAAYEYIENGQKATQPVIDWIGESPRQGESFTYVIRYDPSQAANMRAVKLIEVREE